MIPRQFLIALIVMLIAALALGIYVGRMRGRERTAGTSDVYNRPVAPPVSGPTEQVTLYVADDDAGTVRAQAARIPLPAGRQQRAQELLHALLDLYLDKSSPHTLAPGADIRSIYLVDPGMVVIDLNAAFADNHRSGILVEELTVASLVQTLSANIPGITRVKILVEGKQRDTLAGHANLADFYDTSAINQSVMQMQAQQ